VPGSTESIAYDVRIRRSEQHRDLTSRAARTRSTNPADGQKLWVGLDQIVSSATNFGGSALAGGLLVAKDFGAWAIAYTAFIVMLTAVRTWGGDVMMLLAPRAGLDPGDLASGCATFAGLAGIGAGLVVFVIGGLIGGEVRVAMWSVAIFLPALLLQDSLRYTLLAQRRARSAFINDLLWFAVATSCLMVLRRTDTDSISLAMFAWAGGAVPCVILGLSQTGARLQTQAAGRWIKVAKELASRISAEYVVFMMSSIVMLTVIVGMTGDVEGIGSVRGAQVLMGPLVILFATSTMYLQPILVRAHSRGEPIFTRGIRQTALNAIGVAGWFLIVWLVPRNVGTRVFGFTWDGSRTYLPFVGLAIFSSAISTGAINLLRSSSHVTESLRAHVLIAVVVMASTTTGAIGWQADGAVMAFAVSSLFGPIPLWLAARRAIRSTR